MGISTNNFICLDLGASSTRVTSRDTIVHEVANNVREVGLTEDTHMDLWNMSTFEESLLNALDVTIKREEGANDYVPEIQRVLVGPLADRYGSSVRPSGLEPKHKQSINYINTLVATAVETLVAPGLASTGTQPTDVVLFVALPPIECKGKEKIFIENIKGTYRITFNEMKHEVYVRIVGVMCSSESLLSLYTFFYNENATPRIDTQQYKGANVMCMDIGASTEDNAVMVNGRYIEKSGHTIAIGGNQIRDYITTAVQEEHGFTPSIEEAEYVVHTGRLKIGSKEVDFTTELRAAKEDFAYRLLGQLDGYFKQIGLSLASFACVVVGGGGSLHSSIKEGDAEKITTPALSEIIMTRLHKTCPMVDVMPVPGNPRHANVRGLLVLATMWLTRQMKESQSRQPQVANYNPMVGQTAGRAPEQFTQVGMGQVGATPQNPTQQTAQPYAGQAPNGQVPTGQWSGVPN